MFFLFNLFFYFYFTPQHVWRICRECTMGTQRAYGVKKVLPGGGSSVYLLSEISSFSFSHYSGPCFFAAQHQHCWGPPLRFSAPARCPRSGLFGSRFATRVKTGRFQRRCACVRRRKQACGCSWRKDKPWTATLRRFSPLWGLQWKNR